MNYGIYYTDDTIADAWLPFNNNLPNVIIYELDINFAENKIYAGTHGRGLWVSNTYDTTLSTKDFGLNEITLYPNSAKDYAYLTWSKGDEVAIRVYNSEGKLLFFDKNKTLLEPYKLDLANYASGLYFIKVNSINGEVTKKLLVD